MAMTLAEIRLRQNPVLTSLLLGLGQGTLIAERVFPRLPQALSGITLAKLGNERLRRYNLRRAPGAATPRIDIKYNGEVYVVEEHSVEIPIPREAIREADTSRRLSVGNYLDISQIAMVTANDVLGLDYEIEAAELATDPGNYAVGHTIALAGTSKWSDPASTPVDDVAAAAETIRRAVGRRPNTLTLSPDAWRVLKTNPQVHSYLPDSQQGPATLAQLAQIFDVRDVLIGDAIWQDAAGTSTDVWGNNAILSYVPAISAAGVVSLAEPAHGFTSVIEGSPFAESPYYENDKKSWIYGATFERKANVAYDNAAFLFQAVA